MELTHCVRLFCPLCSIGQQQRPQQTTGGGGGAGVGGAGGDVASQGGMGNVVTGALRSLSAAPHF